MTKRILAFILCIVLLCSSLFSCAKKEDGDVGAYITMYLTDDIYDFDPANAFYNSDASKVLSLMYDTLFKLNDNGKVEKSLVESYKIVEDKENNDYYIEFTLKEAYWSVKDAVSAEDVVFAWSRLLDSTQNHAAASLLYDIKNARAVKEGDLQSYDLGIEAVEDRVLKVSFDRPIDYDQFFLNLTHVSTAPLLRRYVSVNDDWAKKNSTIATSGPFKLGKISYAETGETAFDDNALLKDGSIGSDNYDAMKIAYFYLERNVYYDRDTKRDAIDSAVTPYRLLVDCTKTDEELLQDYQDGKLFYIGSIPLSLRNNELVKEKAEISDSLSTFSCYLNQNALIADGGSGSYLFADARVRQALSMALNRQAIAEAVVFAKAASALVPTGIFESGNSGDFSTSTLATYKLNSAPQVDAAKALLNDAGITNPSKYSFTLKVAAYDEVHVAMAEMIVKTWSEELGFNVTLEKVSPIKNNDYFAQTDSTPPDVCDDLLVESIQRGNFDAVAMDMTAYSADAYSVLANYAYSFSGNMYIYTDLKTEVYEYNTNLTGYDSVTYNIMMEAIYYLPYYASLEAMKNADPKSDPYQVTHAEIQPYVLSAESALRKLNDAVTATKEMLANADQTLGGENATAPNVATVTALAEALLIQLEDLEIAGKQAAKNVVAAQASTQLTTAAQNESTALANQINAILKDSKSLTQAVKNAAASLKNYNYLSERASTTAEELKEAKETAAADLAAALTELTEALNATKAAMTKADSALAAIEALKNGASTQTLKEAIKEVYDANGIVPSEKKADWKKQRTVLLHKAEELLMQDMPVIPVVFNQEAILVSSQLKKVSSTYYTPAYFRKTKLKNYNDYFYYNEEEGKNISIFKNFPTAEWDKIGK